MRAWVVLLLCSGCESLLGLDATTYTPPIPVDAAPPDSPPDSCAPGCSTFASCAAVLQQYPSAPSGVYQIDAGTGMFNTYCELAADGGGWTLALKVDGRNATFQYDEPIWTDANLLRSDAPDLDHVEAKLEAFNALAFTELRVGLEFPIDSGTVQWLVVPMTATSLNALFNGGESQTMLGRDAWKNWMGATASLQLECNLEGVNVGNVYNRVRLGIIANQEADCMTPDSRIGIGGADNMQCMFATPETVGNSACYTPDNGEIEQAAFGYVLVR